MAAIVTLQVTLSDMELRILRIIRRNETDHGRGPLFGDPTRPSLQRLETLGLIALDHDTERATTTPRAVQLLTTIDIDNSHHHAPEAP